MNETHEKCAQLLTVECVLLLGNVNFDMSRRDVIQQHSYKLDQESKSRRWKKGVLGEKKQQKNNSILLSEGSSKTKQPHSHLANVSSGRDFCASPFGSWLHAG